MKYKYIINKTNFFRYYNNLKKCENKQNYDKLIQFLKCKIKNLPVHLILTNANGVLIYNSSFCENTYDNYINGKIPYTHMNEVKSNNISEKVGGYMTNNTISFKIGSNIFVEFVNR